MLSARTLPGLPSENAPGHWQLQQQGLSEARLGWQDFNRFVSSFGAKAGPLQNSSFLHAYVSLLLLLFITMTASVIYILQELHYKMCNANTVLFIVNFHN